MTSPKVLKNLMHRKARMQQTSMYQIFCHELRQAHFEVSFLGETCIRKIDIKTLP